MSEAVINALDIDTLKRPVVAIVCFRGQLEAAEKIPGMRAIHYQVSIDPKSLSPSREFIRFGEIHGDEIVGWIPVEEIVVLEVLAEYAEGVVPPRIPSAQGPFIVVQAQVAPAPEVVGTLN